MLSKTRTGWGKLPACSSRGEGRVGRSRTGGSRFRATSVSDWWQSWKVWATESNELGAENGPMPLGENGRVCAVSRYRMGCAGPRRPTPVRVPDPRRSASGLELGDDSKEARELSYGLRPVRACRRRQVRSE